MSKETARLKNALLNTIHAATTWPERNSMEMVQVQAAMLKKIISIAIDALREIEDTDEG